MNSIESFRTLLFSVSFVAFLVNESNTYFSIQSVAIETITFRNSLRNLLNDIILYTFRVKQTLSN